MAAPAAANGRFPRAQRLIQDPDEPARLLLLATYGMLVTADRGASWQYVCEAAYGVRDLSVDALAALTPDGVLLAGIYSGVSRATPAQGPCGFERTLGMSNREAVPDFAVSASEPGRVLAIHVTIPPQGRPFSQLYRSDDDGASWRALGNRLPEAMQTALTIDLAPSDANRVYLSGLGPNDEGVLLRSSDGGESFDIGKIPVDPTQLEQPYIVAVDPQDPDALYVRTDLWAYDAQAGVAHAGDALLYSGDGGTSFSELLRAGGKLFGFAFSPDGSELLVGYGDPSESGGLRLIDQAALGIYRAPKGAAFEKRYEGSVGCLTWTTEGLFLCTSEADTGFSLGFVAKTDFHLNQPADVEPLLRLSDVAGPIECEACAPGAVCQNYWLATCQSWGRADCQVQQSSPCSVGGNSSAGATGEMGASGEQAGIAGAAGDGTAERSTPRPRPRGGCACRNQARAGVNGHAFLAVLLALLLRRGAAASPLA